PLAPSGAAGPREGEFTIEANPESLTADKIALLARHGVNRVSLGAQSFDARALAVLERAHDPAATEAAVARLCGVIPRVSLDLIFGVPGQTPAGWRDDLRRAIGLGVGHVSTYGLTYEKGTPLWKQRRSGRLVPLGEEDELTLYRAAIETLGDAGFDHYEVSNFARPGEQSRHNHTYWANHAHHGVGLGAARYVGGVRSVNTRDFDAYLAGRRAWQSEELPPAERARETMAVQLRRADGIGRASFRAQTGFDLDAVTDRIPGLVELGLLLDTGDRVFLSSRGKYVADGVIERLL
ncbi:MAG: coproporphyrinogen-III oxidase family protein, partial [Gemmataceae bacterium]